MDRDTVSVPPGWKTESFGDKGATFRNKRKGLDVSVQAVFSAAGRRRHGQTPNYYTVQLQQDWFSKGTLGTRNMSAKVKTAEKALTVAEEFMNEFVREMKQTTPETAQTIHGSVDDHETADDILTSQIAAEALADAAGYSDDLLMSVIKSETNGQYELVAHRDGPTLTTVAGDEDTLTPNSLRTIHTAFPMDVEGIKDLLQQTTPIWTVIQLNNHTVYRFLFDAQRETDVVLERGTEHITPEFGTAIANILEEKW